MVLLGLFPVAPSSFTVSSLAFVTVSHTPYLWPAAGHAKDSRRANLIGSCQWTYSVSGTN